MNSILTSQLNFRDLGGFPAKGGKMVRNGLLFRSGDLGSLSVEDIGILEAMGLATIIDFRSSREIAHRPNKTILTVKEMVHIGIHDAARDEAEELLLKRDAEGMKQVLVRDYRRLVNDHVADFKLFLHKLATTEHLPLVFHCAAGKDRTGLATLFLLTALGVEFSRVVDDYLATNRYTLTNTQKIIAKVTADGADGEILLPLLEVRSAYLEAAMDEINAGYGGIERFVEVTLDADTKVLRRRFLE